MRVKENAGRVNITVGGSTIYDETYGAVIYENGDTEIAYQGGGVWRRQGDSSQMISPPEYHYQGLTLTFPIVHVAGTSAASGQVSGTVSSKGDSQSIYPKSGNEFRSNPLENGTVRIKIESKYCDGWQSFFEDRSDGAVTQECGENDTVRVDLTVPSNLSLDQAIRTNEGIDMTPPKNEPPEPSEQYVNSLPSASPQVEDQIQYCENNSCSTLPSSGSISDGTYYADSDHEFDNIDFDTDNGPINVVINGDLTADGSASISGVDNKVEIYVRGDVTFNGNAEYNTGGKADKLLMFVHSDGKNIDMNGKPQYTGVIYAPNAAVDFNGGGSSSPNLKGSLTADEVQFNGKPSDAEYASELSGQELQFGGNNALITYLHVSNTTVDVEID